MNKKSLFVVLFAMLCLAVFTVSVSADQDGLDRYCNSDQYGCWVTGDNGAQDYIMFWSEYARDLFMGPGSNAVVTDPVPGGRMSLGKASEGRTIRPLTDEEKELITKYAALVYNNNNNKDDYNISQKELEDLMLEYYTNNPDDLISEYNDSIDYYNAKNLSIEEKVQKIAEKYNMPVENYSYDKYHSSFPNKTKEDYENAITNLYLDL